MALAEAAAAAEEAAGPDGIVVLHAASEAASLYARLGFRRVAVRKALVVAMPPPPSPPPTPSAAADAAAPPPAHFAAVSGPAADGLGIDGVASSSCDGVLTATAPHGAAPLPHAWAETGGGTAEPTHWRLRLAEPSDAGALGALRGAFAASRGLVGSHERSAEQWRRYVIGWRAAGRCVVAERRAGAGGPPAEAWEAVGFAVGLCKRDRASVGEFAEDPAEALPGSVAAALLVAAVRAAVALDPACGAASLGSPIGAPMPLAGLPAAALEAARRAGDSASAELPPEHGPSSDHGWMYRPARGFAAEAPAALSRTSEPGPGSCAALDAVLGAEAEGRHVVWDVDGF